MTLNDALNPDCNEFYESTDCSILITETHYQDFKLGDSNWRNPHSSLTPSNHNLQITTGNAGGC